MYQAVAAFFELVRTKAARGVAVESVRIATSYAGGRKFINDHLNVGFGFEF